MAYVAAVVNTTRIVRRIAPGFGFIFGTVNITTYDGTPVEISEITNAFKADPVVMCNGVSDGGYIVRWNASTKSFDAFYPTAGTIAVVAGTDGDAVTNDAGALNSTGGQDLTVSNAAGTEVANGVDVGEVTFIAFGVIN